MTRHFRHLFFAIAVVIPLAGCANTSPDSYSVGSVGEAKRSVSGVIVSADAAASSTALALKKYVVETTNGALITVVQRSSELLTVGGRVRVIYGSRIRITPLRDSGRDDT